MDTRSLMSVEEYLHTSFDDADREYLDGEVVERNMGELPDAQIKAEGTNPLCGDEMSFWVKLSGDRIERVGFTGKGCAISQASASMFTEQLKGKTLQELHGLIAAMKRLMQGEAPNPSVDLGDLESLEGVRKFPVRVKCAALSWNVLEQGLEGYQETTHGADRATSA